MKKIYYYLNISDRWFSPIDRTLRRELKSRNIKYWFDTTSYKTLVDLKIGYNNGYFQIFVPKERLTSSSARIFAFWITFPAVTSNFYSYDFFKNQTRPILKSCRSFREIW